MKRFSNHTVRRRLLGELSRSFQRGLLARESRKDPLGGSARCRIRLGG